MPTQKEKEEVWASMQKEEEKEESKIVIPGITNAKDEPNKKKPVIMEMGSDKYTPNHKISFVNEDGVDKVKIVFDVPEESSAKDIDIDVSTDQIKLNSENYEFDKTFKEYSFDESTVKCKFSKKNKTLTLTIDKVDNLEDVN